MSEELEEQDLPEQIAIRLEKREKLNQIGEAYPVSLPITHTIEATKAKYPNLEADVSTGEVVGLAGRVMFFRNTGKLCFATLQSGTGERIQAMISLDKVGEEQLENWKALVDLGDHIFVQGEVITSKRGELSILADKWLMAAKTIRPMPNLHNELGEEFRVRHRYIDLIVRDRAREVVKIRAEVMQSLRNTFANRAFMEVETPMLQVMHGGASARPFKTHSNAFDTELFLRIAPELFLKRAVV
ncbi:MAG: lysine--tRNA ligase, partial [Actinomycetota bacterium]